MSDFQRDNEWQCAVRDEVLVPHFYRKHAADGRFVMVDKGRIANVLQREMAVDTIVQAKDGCAVAIEEKIVRYPGYTYLNFALETDSCTVPGRERAGWMQYGRPDYLLYAFCRPDCTLSYLIEFEALKAWFWQHIEEFEPFRMEKTLNKSAGRQVPIIDVSKNVKCWSLRMPAYSGPIVKERKSDGPQVEMF